MKLIADAMLGRLARWLRALGHDVVFDETLDDPALARRARREDRRLLTRDRQLCEELAPAHCRLVHAAKPAAQLVELDRSLDLFPQDWRDRLFTRCLVCNAPLEPVPYDQARDHLPGDVRADPRVRSPGFLRCEGCHRIYWEGSHTRRMRRWLEEVRRKSVAEPRKI